MFMMSHLYEGRPPGMGFTRVTRSPEISGLARKKSPRPEAREFFHSPECKKYKANSLKFWGYLSSFHQYLSQKSAGLVRNRDL